LTNPRDCLAAVESRHAQIHKYHVWQESGCFPNRVFSAIHGLGPEAIVCDRVDERVGELLIVVNY